MRILLIEPPYFRLMGERKRWIPLGLLYISSVLKDQGHDVIIYNSDADFLCDDEVVLSYTDRFLKTEHILSSFLLKKKIYGEIRQTIATTKPHIIGISVKSDCVPFVIDIISIINDLKTGSLLMLGGPHFELSEDYPYFSKADLIFKGEAEQTILDGLHYLINSDRKYKHIKIIKTESSGLSDLDELPLLNLDNLVEWQFKQITKMRKQMISSARGCPFGCWFCFKSISFGSKIRLLSGSKLAGNMINLNEKYGIKKFYIVDDTFGIDINQLEHMEKSIREYGNKFSWSCMSHVKVLDSYKLSLMNKMGCNAIHLGVESGSDRMLKLLHKNVTVDDIINCAELIKENGIELRAFMMVGLPWEDDNDVINSFKLIDKISPDEIAAQVYQPYPKTTLYNFLEKNNISLDINWKEFRRFDLNFNLYPDQKPSKVMERIVKFLQYADAHNLRMIKSCQ